MIFKILSAIVLIFFLHTTEVDCQCNFSSSLLGVWNGADRGMMKFENSTFLSFYKTLNQDFLPATLDFVCLENQNNKYLLKATTENIFGGATLKYYLCIDLYIVDVNIAYYYLLTEYEDFLNDYIFGFVPDNVTMADVCSRQTTPGNFIVMVRNDSVADSLINTDCPAALFAVFDNVTTQWHGNSVTYNCVGTVFDICTDRTMINITYGDTCGNASAKTLSNNGIYRCIHSITDESFTYLAVWNSEDGVTNPFSCLVLERSGDTVFASESPKVCSNTSSPTTTETGGVKIVLTDVTRTCDDITTSTTSALVDTTNVAGLWGLTAIPIVIIVIAVTSLLICRHTKTRQEINLDIFGSTTVHADVAGKPIFNPSSIHRSKMSSINSRGSFQIFTPIFDSKWFSEGSKRLKPAPKVAPLYTDVMDD